MLRLHDPDAEGAVSRLAGVLAAPHSVRPGAGVEMPGAAES